MSRKRKPETHSFWRYFFEDVWKYVNTDIKIEPDIDAEMTKEDVSFAMELPYVANMQEEYQNVLCMNRTLWAALYHRDIIPQFDYFKHPCACSADLREPKLWDGECWSFTIEDIVCMTNNLGINDSWFEKYLLPDNLRIRHRLRPIRDDGSQVIPPWRNWSVSYLRQWLKKLEFHQISNEVYRHPAMRKYCMSTTQTREEWDDVWLAFKGALLFPNRNLKKKEREDTETDSDEDTDLIQVNDDYLLKVRCAGDASSDDQVRQRIRESLGVLPHFTRSQNFVISWEGNHMDHLIERFTEDLRWLNQHEKEKAMCDLNSALAKDWNWGDYLTSESYPAEVHLTVDREFWIRHPYVAMFFLSRKEVLSMPFSFRKWVRVHCPLKLEEAQTTEDQLEDPGCDITQISEMLSQADTLKTSTIMSSIRFSLELFTRHHWTRSFLHILGS